MPLRLKILLSTLVLLVGIVGGVFLVLGQVVQTQVRTYTDQLAARTKSAVTKDFTQTERSLLATDTLLADRPGTKDIYRTNEQSISEHLNEQKKILGTDWVAMTNDLGEVIGTSDASPFKGGEDVSKLPALVQAQDSKSWSGLVANDERASLTAAVPVVIHGYLKSVIFMGKRVDTDFLKSISKSVGGEVALVVNGHVVASTLPVYNLNLATDDLKQFQIGSQTYVSRSDQLSNVEGQDVQLVSMTPLSAATNPFLPLWNALTFIAAVAGVAALVFGVVFAAGVTRPLKGLVTAAKTLQTGKWPEPFRTHRKDEIGLLQRVFDDMTASLKESYDRLVAMLEKDPLTTLDNHRTFRAKLDRAFTGADGNSSFAVLVIDLDQFELFNQMHGHESGDQALVIIADILRESLPKTSVHSRYAGNQFAALCYDDSDPFIVAEKIRRRIEEGTEVTASIGICIPDATTSRPDLMCLAAETAAAQAKAGGRNCVRKFEGFQVGSNTDDLRLYLQQGSYAAILALAQAVDAKDEYTRGHSQRVAEYARDLAEALEYDKGFVDLVYMTGTLHDVGKIGVPDDVLKKTSRLTDEEFDMIKTHPELGEKIVLQIPQLRDCLPGVRSHHERYDGRGYPDKLAGEDIHIIARILAVADTYDAMTSDRPYRKGLPVQVALSEIHKGAGTQFDPELAYKFIEIMGGLEEEPGENIPKAA